MVVEDVEPGTPEAGEVLVDVAAASVNFPDLLIIENKYQIKPPLPFTPGSEFSGTVAALGPGVTDLAIGDRVIGLCLHGAYQQQMVISENRCIALPESIDFHCAATLSLAYGTTLHALQDRASMAAGETLLVLGASGGVGLAAVEIGKAMGARVIAAASSEEKLQLCRDHGADETLLYSPHGLDKAAQREFSQSIKALTNGQGADVVYDPIGGDYAEPAIRALNWKGRYLVIGFAAGGIPTIPLNLALLKGCSLVGVFWGEFVRREPQANRANFQALFEYFQQGHIQPHIDAVYPLERTADALKQLASRRSRGKLIIDLLA